MEVVFLGYNDVGLDVYDWLCDRVDVSVLALVTRNDQLDIVSRLQPDLLVSVGYDHLVPEEVLSVPSDGAVNMHPSLLPFNRGKSPNVWPIVEGTPAGVSLHYMDTEFDTGDIIAQREVEVDFADTGKDLHERLERAQFDLFTDVWPAISAGDVDFTPQSDKEGTYHTTEDFLNLCELDPKVEVQVRPFLNRLRALTFPPFDNARLNIDGKTYYVDIDIRRGPSDEEPDDSRLSSY